MCIIVYIYIYVYTYLYMYIHNHIHVTFIASLVKSYLRRYVHGCTGVPTFCPGTNGAQGANGVIGGRTCQSCLGIDGKAKTRSSY